MKKLTSLSILFFTLNLLAQTKAPTSVPATAKEEVVLPTLTKSPKSLFLIKKAKIDNDVGEPVIYPSDKQSRLLSDEKIFNKYRLQILEPKN